jgi:hypothetical protein
MPAKMECRRMFLPPSEPVLDVTPQLLDGRQIRTLCRPVQHEHVLHEQPSMWTVCRGVVLLKHALASPEPFVQAEDNVIVGQEPDVRLTGYGGRTSDQRGP